jgi:SHS2 domain-containing protein
MRGSRSLSHTADEGFEVWAPTLGGIYEESVRALFRLVGEPHEVRPGPPFELTSAGVDREDLLVRLLTDVLGRFATDGAWIADAACTSIERRADGDLVATLQCRGGSVDPDAEPSLQEIKAVTYHGLEIRGDATGLHARVFVDV